jgi:hypothetical protein
MKIIYPRNRVIEKRLTRRAVCQTPDFCAALMLTLMLVIVKPLAGQKAPPIKAMDALQKVGQLKAVSFSFDSNITPVAKNTLNELKDVSVTIATSGRPVLVGIFPDNNPQNTKEPFAIVLTSSNLSNWTITILREDGYQVASFSMQGVKAPDLYLEIPFSLNGIDAPAPGLHTYTIRMQSPIGRCQVKGARLVAYEL